MTTKGGIMRLALALIICFSQAAFGQRLGWGSDTPGGAGGEIVRVTNTNASGAGSFKSAVERTGRRIVVFETSGTIQLTDWIRLQDPFITIAGQTAPSPGITIRGAGIRVMTHDVKIQHIRIRVGDGPGPDPGSRDAIEILANNQDCYGIWIDHVSASWAIDENVSVYGPNQTWAAHDITVSNCIVSEALMAGHPNPGHRSDGLLVGSTGGAQLFRIAFTRNLLASNNARNPTTQAQSLVVANQVTYNWGGKHWLLRAEGAQPHGSAWINNVSRTGPNTRLNGVLFEIDPDPLNGYVYLEGNDLPDIRMWNVASPPLVSERPELPAGFDILPTDQTLEYVLDHAGARPLDRDAVDARIVADAQNGTGDLINSQNDKGGWPALAVNARPFVAEADVEAQLKRMAVELEDGEVYEPPTCSIQGTSRRNWIQVTWESTGGELVLLNGEPVEPSGTLRIRQIPPASFELVVVGPGGTCLSRVDIRGRSDR